MSTQKGDLKMIGVTISVPEPVWLRLRRIAEGNRMNGRGRASVSGLVNRWLLERMDREAGPEEAAGRE